MSPGLQLSELVVQDVARQMVRDVMQSACKCVFFDYSTGERIRSFRTAWAYACLRFGLVEVNAGARKKNLRPKAAKLFHDLRRTGVRNLVRAGVSEKVAMRISGHKTRAVFDRYNITDERDLHIAARRSAEYHSARKTVADTDTMRTPKADATAKSTDSGGNLLQ